MVPSRSLVVLVAATLAVVAGVTAYGALHSAQQKVFRHQRVATVYVVRATVPRAESAADAAAQGLIVPSPMPARYVPTDAVRTLSTIDTDVAGAELATGEVVVRGMFVSATDNPGAAAQSLPAGDVAVSVSVSPSEAVAGMIEPGDTVDVLLDLHGGTETDLYPSVPVLAVGQTLVPPPGAAPSSPAGATPTFNDLVTFAVPPAVAAHIPPARSGAGGVTQGLYLALDRSGTVPSTGPGLALPGSSLIPGFGTTTTTTTTTPDRSSGGEDDDVGPNGELEP
ncbi:MAG TPA: RcpC/CpaB family pilus assembly protein [Acidimicrobiales bacterium]|nr:RcpC/CpaB family pilus assembly protein [Acidimicrobiales bacterium]